MPTKYRRKTRGKAKKKAGSKAVTRRSKGPIYRMPFPQKRYVTFTWSSFGSLAAVAAGTDSNVFSFNNLYDPDTTGAANFKPRYFDQLLSNLLYFHYRVNSVGYRIEVVNKSNTNDIVASVAFRDKIAGSPATAADNWNIKTQNNSIVRTILPLGSEKSRQVFKGRKEVWPILASSKAEYLADDSFEGSYNAGPTQTAITTLTVSDSPGGTMGATADWYATFYFNVCVYDRSDIVGES